MEVAAAFNPQGSLHKNFPEEADWELSVAGSVLAEAA